MRDHAEWAKRHLALFGLYGEEAARSGVEWALHFRDAGEDPGELWRASKRLAAVRRDRPLRLHEHLDALKATLVGLRQEVLAEAARRAQDPGPADCPRGCDGGWLEPGGGARVTCDCERGRANCYWLRKRGHAVESLAEYQARRQATPG